MAQKPDLQPQPPAEHHGFQPWGFQGFQTRSPTLSNAVLSTTEIAMPPPAVSTAQAHFGSTSTFTADAELIPALRRVIVGNLAADAPDNRATAQSLLQATQAKITQLREARFNDAETADLVEFLEWLVRGLTAIIENLDRAIAQPSEPLFLGTAGQIAYQLKLGLLEAVEKHRARVWEISAVVGVACFLSSLSGEKLTDIMRILFDRK